MARFRPNPNFERELRARSDLTEAVAKAAEPAAEEAERLAGRPWMGRKGEPRQIEVTVEGDEVFLVNHDHGGHLKEYGSRNNPPVAPLRRGAQAAGLRLGGE